MRLLDKLIELEREFSAAYGGFTLFAWLKREGAMGKWDLVLAAPWLSRIRDERSNRLYSTLSQRLSAEELLLLSQVIILNPGDPFVRELGQVLEWEARIGGPARRQVANEHEDGNGIVDFRDCDIGGMQFERGIVITYRPEAAAVATTSAS